MDLNILFDVVKFDRPFRIKTYTVNVAKATKNIRIWYSK